MPSGDRCPTLIVRGAPPSIDTTALLPKRPTTFTSVAAAGPASASESAAAIQSVRFIRASAMRPIAIFRYSPSEGPGYFADYLEARGRLWRIVRIDQGEGVPDDPRAFGGLVLMGGPMSVNDDLAWIPPTLGLVHRAVDAGVPCLDHCLNDQLMSKALGNAVTRNPVKEIGWNAVRVADRPETER